MRTNLWGNKILTVLLALMLALGGITPLPTLATGHSMGSSAGQAVLAAVGQSLQAAPQFSGQTMRAKITLNGTLYTEPLAVELYSVNSPAYEIDQRYSQDGYVEFPLPETPVQEDCYFYIRHTPGVHATYNGQTEGQLIRFTAQGDLEIALYEGYTVTTKVIQNGKPKSGVEVILCDEIWFESAGELVDISRDFFVVESNQNGIATFTNVPKLNLAYFEVDRKEGSHAPYLGEQGGDTFSVPSTRYPDVPLYEGYTLNAKITWGGKPLKNVNLWLREFASNGTAIKSCTVTTDHNGFVSISNAPQGKLLFTAYWEDLYEYPELVMDEDESFFKTNTFYAYSSNMIYADFDSNYALESRLEQGRERARDLTASNGISTANQTFAGGSSIRFPLYASDFEWTGTPGKLTTARLKESGYGLNYKFRDSGDIAIKSVSFEDTSTGVDIVLQFASPKNNVALTGEVYVTFNDSVRTMLTGDFTNCTLQGSSGGGSSGGGGSSSGGGGSSSGGSSGGRTSISNAIFDPTGKSGGTSTSGSATAVDSDWAVKEVQAALKAPNTAGQAAVKIRNASTLSLSVMKEMISAAGTAPVVLHADTLNEAGGVNVRISINPALATKNINLQASTFSAPALALQARFAKYFSNNLMVLHFAQNGDFGMPVELAVKLSEGLEKENLVFYSYDTATNIYNRLDVTYTVDTNGYVKFTTSAAGAILIVNNPLQAK